MRLGTAFCHSGNGAALCLDLSLLVHFQQCLLIDVHLPHEIHVMQLVVNIQVEQLQKNQTDYNWAVAIPRDIAKYSDDVILLRG